MNCDHNWITYTKPRRTTLEFRYGPEPIRQICTECFKKRTGRIVWSDEE